MSILGAAAAIVIAGLLAVERKAFLQAAFSRPLLAGTLLGLTLGQPALGLTLGAAFELFYLGSVNLGAVLPDNDLFGTAAAACCACALAASAPVSGPTALALATLLALLTAKLGRSSDRLSERVNAWGAACAQCGGEARARLRFNLYGLWMPFASTAAMAAVGLLLGALALPPLLGALPVRAEQALGLGWNGFVLVAAAAALRSIHTLRAGLYGLAAALLAVGGQVMIGSWVF